ncbi:MAG: hypothetical protein LUE24_13115 [Lachnospiraceae bacterium]|nr:hypothetical protein [Lachnospiraceae bacterium]
MLILKILGILILSILALILLILCALLFAPVTYRLRLDKQDRAEVNARVGWLLHFVSVRYRLLYPGEDGGLFQDLQVWILGFTVLRPFAEKEEKPPDHRKKKEKKKSKRAKEEADKISGAERVETTRAGSPDEAVQVRTGEKSIETVQKDRSGEGVREASREESADRPPYDSSDEVSDKVRHQECERTVSCSERAGEALSWNDFEKSFQNESSKSQQESAQKHQEVQNPKTEVPSDFPQYPPDETKHKEKKLRVPLGERIRGIFRKITGIIRGLCDKLRHIGESLQNLLHKKDELLSFWRMDEFVRARAFLLKELKHLWKRYRPRRVEGALHFGFDDPSMTGLCMGALSILSPWYPGKMDFTPDFERKILEGNLEIRGHMQLYVLLFAALRIWRNRDVRYMYGRWKER